jgi:DNA-binding XRE family transcriptional regulator
MSLQIIKSIHGQAEYVLLPIFLYKELHELIEKKLQTVSQSEYVPFLPEDYLDNPISLARIKANITQTELANRLGVSQAYISKVEKQNKVSSKLLRRVKLALNKS